ncbi:hypothetical protein [Streptomyces sp. NPDC048002]|uniref:hypothetical protein n=1 Tax=unclassified Streptomyces TaxID=2593676 RepID=UPI00341116A1
MTEAENPESAESPVEVVAEAPVKKKVRVGRILAVAGSLVLVGALVAGVGYTVVTVRGADRDAGAPVWKFPRGESGGRAHAAKPSGLSAVLVPYDDYWTRGPDLTEFGSDEALSGAEATALRKESLRGLPRTQRREMEKQIDKARYTGMAMRSYVQTGGSSPSAVSIILSRMENRTSVRRNTVFYNELLDAIDVFEAGPKIEGHKDTKCFLLPSDVTYGEDEDEGEGLDHLLCSGYQGDVMVTAVADGVESMDTDAIASLLKTQLDRIAEPGAAV